MKETKTTDDSDAIPTVTQLAHGLPLALMCLAVFAGYRPAGLVQTIALLLAMIRIGNAKETNTTDDSDAIPTVAWLVLGVMMCLAVFAGYRLAGLVQTIAPTLAEPKEKSTQTDLRGIDLNDLTVDAIKMRLACHRLLGAGTKPELITRLIVVEPWWRTT